MMTVAETEKKAFWRATALCLERFFDMESKAAEQACLEFRRRLQRALGERYEIIYHDEPYYVARGIIGQPDADLTEAQNGEYDNILDECNW